MNWFQRTKQALSAESNPLFRALQGQRSPAPGRRLALETLEPRWVMSHVAPGLVDTPQTYSGALDGKVVFTSGGHGWQWSTALGRYATDRGDNNEIVEDFGNQEQMSHYADELLRAGATVVPMRPIGRQLNEVVLDNDSAGVTFTGSWSNSSGTQFYDEDYGAAGDAVPYRFAGTTSGAENSVATYTPNIPQAGFYPVYTWVARGANRTTQLYRINHTGGETDIRVDHRAVGFGWVYLGTYHFNSGSSAALGSVEISNNSAVPGNVIADAIRFGNGMGDYIWTASGASAISGKPREDENSYHWIARMVGQGTSLTTAIGSGTSNVSAPSNMAEHMYSGAFNNALYVGIHSNAGGGRGARGLIDADAGDRTPNQSNLALFLGRQINQDFQALPGVFEADWGTGTTHTFTGQFGEIDLGSGAEMDATIIEIAFHDNAQDAIIMRDPDGRDQIARSMLQGTIEYFQNHGGLAVTTSLPKAPIDVRAVSNASGEATLSWSAGPSTPAGVNGAAATSYKVYASIDGYGFDGGTVVAGTSATLTGLDPTRPYYFRVAGVNAGGESKPSEVMTVLPSGGTKQVLIVSGFDRMTTAQNFRYAYPHTGDGLVDRVWARYNNSYDYVVQVHAAIDAVEPGLHVASASNEAVINGTVNLNDYDTVIWVLGEESTTTDTFNATEQTAVTNFINAGGNLFLSGSEIAWDLDAQGGGVSFFENTLKGNYVSDDAGTNTATADAGGIFAGLSDFAFSTGATFSSLDGELYNVESPDIIAPQAGAVAALTYSGGAGVRTAAIQFGPGGIGSGSIVMFGFPFEAITSATRRQEAMGRILDFFSVAAPAPEIDIKTRVNGLDADFPTGPVLAAGGSATFTYELTNPGNAPLSSVAVSDDNGTPGVPGDDFAPSFTGGDTNSNSMLDQGETWTYTAIRTVFAGQYSNVGSVSAVGLSTNVADSDTANYFGSAPGVNVETFVEGQDADLPTGQTFATGNFVSFTYVLTNTGNVAVSVNLIDNNGTPTVADDFAPVYAGGDTNANSLLDIGETWNYSASREVSSGQYAGEGQATAVDSIVQSVVDTDATNYFGALPDIGIETLVNGDEADLPTGPNLAAGSSATFTYIVTNAGNIALGGVVVTDDNGTPGNTADDFNPTFVGGDTNSNNLLDTDETWTFSAIHTVTVGQYTNQGSVSASDIVSQVVMYIDAANHLGFVAENADFNADSSVDAADYVVWRKFSGATVPTGTLGDANFDTQVDDDDYAVFTSQFGESIGGGGAAGPGAVAMSEDAAAEEAVFSWIATGRVDIRTSSRSTTRLQSRSPLAVNNEWPALLAAIAEQRASHHQELDELDTCGVGLRGIMHVQPAEPGLAEVRLLPSARSAISRIRVR